MAAASVSLRGYSSQTRQLTNSQGSALLGKVVAQIRRVPSHWVAGARGILISPSLAHGAQDSAPVRAGVPLPGKGIVSILARRALQH